MYQDEDLDGKITHKVENGLRIESEVFQGDDLLYEIQYKYLDSNLVEIKVLDSGGNLKYKIENTWSNDFLAKKITKNDQGNPEFIRAFERNENGDVIKSTTEYPQDSSEFFYTCEYEYDANNNWIKKYQISERGDLQEIIVRDITYAN